MTFIFPAIQKVFRGPAYILLALVTGFLLFAFIVLLPNLSTVIKIFASSDTPLTQKFALPVALLGSIATNFTILSAFSTIIIAILFGINLAMMTYSLRQKINIVKQGGVATGFIGVASAFLGTGCAACGSLFLINLLPFLGASGAMALFPFHGSEFGIISIFLLMVSLFIVAKQIQNPAVCEVGKISEK